MNNIKNNNIILNINYSINKNNNVNKMYKIHRSIVYISTNDYTHNKS